MKTITKIILTTLLCLLLIGCREVVTGEDAYEIVTRNEGELLLSAEQPDLDEETVPTVPEDLPIKQVINTYDTASLWVSLAKGEVFNVRMYISPYAAKGSPSDNFIFKVLDEWHKVVIDAGRIEGVYELTFTAEHSGKYLLCFYDDRGHCTIELHHDYGE